MSIRTAYTALLAPLSPYRDTPNMPNWGLWHRVNDDHGKNIPRIACMAVWALIGAVAVAVMVTLDHLLPPMRSPTHHTVVAVLFMMSWKILDVFTGPKYKPDPLDWTCDVICMGGAASYSVAHILAHSPLDWRVYAVLTVLWILTFPWSTPR
jgi:hypothetical protein